MPQAFRPHTVLLLKTAALLGGALLAGVLLIARWAVSPAAARGEAVSQIIPFSHKHHVGDDGIDCRFCHQGVERAAFAGLPSTQTCLTCHSQLLRDAPVLAPLHASAASGQPLRWTRVHDLPDFVYFEHRIHVGKGVACTSCHGQVEQMPLMRRHASLDMQWCLACHRSVPLLPAEQQSMQRWLRIPDQRRLNDCSTCHR
jgi:hypothetical protein